MADNEGLANGDRYVEITDDKVSSKDSVLTQKLAELENEKGKILEANEGYKKQLEELKVAIEELRGDNQELKCELQKLESDKKVLEAVADRAACLETEVSGLHHELGEAMSNLQESMAEIDGLGKELERVRESGKEKDAKLVAIGNEMGILSSKIVELKTVENSLKNEKQQMEAEIQNLKNIIEEFPGATQTMKADLKKTIDNLKQEISVLESNMREREKMICRYESERVKGSFPNDTEEKGLIKCLEENHSIILGGSIIAAVGIMGVVCYLRAAKKN